MCTDKSNKFALTDIETYRAMGAVHTSKDKKISRKEMIEREKELNSHAAMWNKMLNQGQDREQGGRIHDSLVSHDQALAVMTLLLKDRKAGNKSRAVLTGNSSNSVGLSITVSMFLEAIASSIEGPYEVKSSEDLIAVFEEVNEKWRHRMEEDVREDLSEQTERQTCQVELLCSEREGQMSEQTEIQTSLVIEPASHEREDHRSEQTEKRTSLVIESAIPP
jgi:hypothetical protein